MSRRTAFAITALALALAGCGSRGDLTPPPGQSLPVAPYGRGDRLTADELLTRTPQAAPERRVELRRRSEERQDDPFDLPPEEAGVRRTPPAVAPGACRQQEAQQGSAPELASCSDAVVAKAAG